MTSVSAEKFGLTKENEEVTLYRVSSKTCSVGIINYGGIITFLKAADKSGNLDDVVTGFQDMQGYYDRSRFFGCIVGRFGNRIAKGKFTLDGNDYNLPINNGPNSLHGGLVGFDKKLWKADVVENGVKLSLVSPDNDQGYPGELKLVVTYTLVESTLSVDYKATTNKATPINITNHSYFNLSGHSKWDTNLSKHEITICSDAYLPADENCLVTGEIKDVKNTKFDLRQATMLTEDLLESIPGGGFDHTFCLPQNKKLNRVVKLRHLDSGRIMEVETNAPGVQFYTSNFLTGMEGKEGVKYHRHSALCLETQNWPDAINHPETFPDCVLRPGEEYHHKTNLVFSSI